MKPRCWAFRKSSATAATWASMLIGKAFLKIPYVSLVNLVLRREAVRELLQHHMTMKNATRRTVSDPAGRRETRKMLADYAELQRLIGQKIRPTVCCTYGGVAAQKT
ncbi:MAG: hypothetical protein ACLR8Y_03280 [Alistipes indistinctus]